MNNKNRENDYKKSKYHKHGIHAINNQKSIKEVCNHRHFLYLLSFVLVLVVITTVTPPIHASHNNSNCSLGVTPSRTLITDSVGNPRNNPDGTFYPGDAFQYHFRYYFSSGCISPRVHGVVDHGAINDESGNSASFSSRGGTVTGIGGVLIAEANDCLGKRKTSFPVGYGGVNGWKTSWGESRNDCGKLTMTISAKERICPHNGGTCYYVTRTASGTIKPDVVAPIVEVNLIEHIINDPDNYMAANHDYTNYPWDPITIEHIATFTWNTEREGTITFRYDRTFPGLVEEGGIECDKRCTEQLQVNNGKTPISQATGIGFLPYPHKAENGGGIHAYTAPDLSQAGWHTITYDVTVLNQGKPINMHTNNTEQLVVLYEPVFDYHPYTVFNDGNKWAYDNRHGIIMLYHGSIGSGPGDSPEIHDMRRSKINSFYPNTTSFSDSVFIPPFTVPAHLMSWNSSRTIQGTDEQAFVTTWDGTDRKGHAMFERAGYGVIRFDQMISQLLLENDNEYNWYFNTTTHNHIASDEWAGYNINKIFDYFYHYPHTELAEWFNGTIYTADQNVDRTGVLTVQAIPINVTDVIGIDYYPTTINPTFQLSHNSKTSIVLLLNDYLWAKTIHDTNDENFAMAILQDLFNMTNQKTSRNGQINMWVNKTAIHFYPLILVSYKINSTDHSSSPFNVLDIPLHEALTMEPTFSFNMTANDHSRNAVTLFDFNRGYHEIINMDTGNEINASRPSILKLVEGPSIDFTIPPTFGRSSHAILKYEGDEDTVIPINDECLDTCSVRIGHARTDVTINNTWGGTTKPLTINTTKSYTGIQPLNNNIEQLLQWAWLLLPFIGTGYIVYRVVKRASAIRND